jgi:hypothetical protein
MNRLFFILLGFFLNPFAAKTQTLSLDTIPWTADLEIRIETKESNYVVLQVINSRTNEVLYTPEEDCICTVGRFYGHQKAKIKGKNAIFLSHHSGGEGMVVGSLLVLIEENGRIKEQLFEGNIIEYELIDLNRDQSPELVLNEYPYYKLKLEDCSKQTDPDPYFSGKIMPQILEYQNDFFRKVADEMFLEAMLKQYVRHLEARMKAKMPQKEDILTFLHYFYCAFSADMEKTMWDFFKAHNQTVVYECSEGEKPFRIEMKLVDFFQKYQEVLLFGK